MDARVATDFGYWLAGLTDGEGSFQIAPNRPGFVCRFSIGLRDDDAPVLSAIHATLGYGAIRAQRRPLGQRRKPLALFRVERKDDCQKICLFFHEFPLRSKKLRDFLVWEQAVKEMALMPPANGRPRDWTKVAQLRDDLALVRQYPDRPVVLRLSGVEGGA